MIHTWTVALVMAFAFNQLPFCAFEEAETNHTHLKPTLKLLASLPFPDETLSQIYSGGHSLVPAVQLAVDHINKCSEFLPEYTLDVVIVDSGCNTDKARSSLFENVVHGSTPIAGIVGPVCSEAALVIAPLNIIGRLGVTQVTTGTSPLLNSRTNYPITFGIVSSSLVFANTFIALIEHNQWKIISIFYESDNRYYSSVYQSFTETFSRRFPTENIKFASEITLNLVPIEAVVNLGIRIVIVIASSSSTRSLICLAYYNKIQFPTYQFVIMELSLESLLQEHKFVYNGVEYDCSAETMQKALTGSVLTSYNFTSTAPEIVTVSGLTFAQLQSDYEQKFKEYSDAINMSVDEDVYSYPYVFYDAVWALTMGLHHSSPVLKEMNQSLSSLDMFWTDATEVVRDSMYRTEFQGASGWISFDNETRRANTVVDILQVDDEGLAVLVGYYNAGDTVIINERSFVNDSLYLDFSILHPAVTAVGSVFVLIALLLSIALYAATLYYGKVPSVKATAPKLNFFIFLGCCLIVASVIALTLQSSSHSSEEAVGIGLCTTYTWCLNFGYTLIFGTLLVKSWRLYQIFFRSFKVGEYLTDFMLSLMVMMLLLVDIILCVAWVVAFPVKESEVDISNTPLHVILQRTCTYTWFLAVELGYKGILTLAVLCLTIANRRIKQKSFRNTRSINTLVYSLVLVTGIGLPTSIILNYLRFNVNVTYSVTSAMLIIIVYLCLFLIFFPPLIPVFKNRRHL